MNNEAKALAKARLDYALVLVHVNGYTKEDAKQAAEQTDTGDELFAALYTSTLLLLRTGMVIDTDGPSKSPFDKHEQ